jgi:predicted MPP superfamily phosphohydrolase
MEPVFDIIIYFFLAVTATYLIHGFHFWNTTRSSSCRLGIFFILLIGWLTVFYGSFIEPRMIIVRSEYLRLSEQPTQTLNAVLLSDLHVGPFKKQEWAQKVVEQIQANKPDIIFLLGDFVVTSPSETKYLQPLKQLSAPYGVYAVTGNHEYETDSESNVKSALEEFGIEVIENEVLNIEINGYVLKLAGVSDIWFDGDLQKTMQDITPEQSVILLAHNPDVVLSEITHRADAVLAGHTHGGQIRLPLVGPISAIPTKLGRAYDEGWFTYEKLKLFITSGVGESGARARLFNPPEIIQMEIKF